MTGGITAFCGAAVFDGQQLHPDHALLVRDGSVEGIVACHERPGDAAVVDLSGGVVAPGFVDLQVNGGGGVMLGDDPTPRGLARIAAAHARVGATTILPTLITDTPDITAAAIEAAVTSVTQQDPGIAGLHLEGPHLAPVRAGAHDPALIRPMQQSDLEMLCAAAGRLPVLMVTLAPEAVSLDQIARLANAGVIVSLGHTDAGFEMCSAAVAAGARCATHLFNAMRQLTGREPGMVGAALALGDLSAGLIADGVHVHAQAMTVALAAKQGPGRIFLVSDAMAVAGTDLEEFMLQGRGIARNNGRLTLEDGTLAGADLDLAGAVANVVACGVPNEQALAMATSVPASLIRSSGAAGRLFAGGRADFVYLDDGFNLLGVWQGGNAVSQTSNLLSGA